MLCEIIKLSEIIKISVRIIALMYSEIIKIILRIIALVADFVVDSVGVDSTWTVLQVWVLTTWTVLWVLTVPGLCCGC